MSRGSGKRGEPGNYSVSLSVSIEEERFQIEDSGERSESELLISDPPKVGQVADF